MFYSHLKLLNKQFVNTIREEGKDYFISPELHELLKRWHSRSKDESC